MSNSFYLKTWQNAISDLEDQLRIEGVIDDDNEVVDKSKLPNNVTLTQAFQHFACLYVKYLEIFKNVEKCYDNIVQPQQRMHIKTLLELVIRRIIELRHELVKWNPPNSYMRIMSQDNKEEYFPWEIVHFDEILVDLKLSPDILELHIPKYFKEDNSRIRQERDNIVSAYMKMKYNTDEVYITDNYEISMAQSDLTVEQAIAIIQRNERGRQAYDSVAKLQNFRRHHQHHTPIGSGRSNKISNASTSKTNSKNNINSTSHSIKNHYDEYDADYMTDDTYDAAISIQRIYRGYQGRMASQKERDNELMFLGMESRPDSSEILKQDLCISYRKRKQEQEENKEVYDSSLVELKQVIAETEGSMYKEKLRQERMKWMSDQIAQGKFPTSMDEFYTSQTNNNNDSTLSATADAKNTTTTNGKTDDKLNTTTKSAKETARPGSKGTGGDGKGKNKEKPGSATNKTDSKSNSTLDDSAMPKLQKKSELTDKMVQVIGNYTDVWEDKILGNNTDDFDNNNETCNINYFGNNSITSSNHHHHHSNSVTTNNNNNKNSTNIIGAESKYDEVLAKEVVQPGVYDDLRKQIDDLLILNLSKIQLQLDASAGGKKSKGGKKGKGGKGKKAKKAKKVGGAGGKGKKKKALPGEKIADLKGLDTIQMLSHLIEANLIVKCRSRKITSLVGDFNYLGSLYHDSDKQDINTWLPEDPSISQLRHMLTEYCILPNGSQEIHAAIDEDELIKTVMLYGPRGTGKTLAVEIIAHELGALLIHITPEKVRGLFPGKTGPTILVHMVMTIARDPAMQPVVIYIDECEQFFGNGSAGGGGKKSKNKDKDGPSRFKKDFLLYKKQALTAEHRCVIIGSTNLPEDGDIKDMRGFFDKFIYMPYPDYASRLLIWRFYLEERARAGLFPTASTSTTDNVSGGTLSAIGSGRSGGSQNGSARDNTNEDGTDGGNGENNSKTNNNTTGLTSITIGKSDNIYNTEDAEEAIMSMNLTSAQAASLEIKRNAAVKYALKDIDVSSLAKVSEGYSAGAIARAARSVLITRRVHVLKTRPVNCLDFIDSLSLQPVTYQDDKIVFTKFIQTITSLEDRRKKVEVGLKNQAVANEKGGGADKKATTKPTPKKQ